MSLESYNNFFNSVAESAGAAAGAGAAGGALGAAGVGAGTGAVEGIVDNVQDFSWVGDENKNSDGYHYNEVKEEPKMTVDEVYGKSNQSIVENQGDYSASSNEKSNVDTSTFGKQNDITVTPVSVTENKGIVNNSTIQSVEGLDFQQKDKASQDVLDSRKKRDEAEAEDKSSQMRDNIKAAVTGNKSEEDVNPFQIGESEAEKTQRVLQEKQKAAEDADKAFKEAEANANKLKEQYDKAQNLLYKANDITSQEELFDLAVKVGEAETALNKARMDKIEADSSYAYEQKKAKEAGYTNTMTTESAPASNAETATTPVEEETAAPTSNAATAIATATAIAAAIAAAKDDINNSTSASEEEKAAANEALTKINTSATSAKDAASKLTENLDNVSDADIDAYMAAIKELNKNIAAYKAVIDEMHSNRRSQLTDELDRLERGAKFIEQNQEKLSGKIAEIEKKSIAANEAYNKLKNESFVSETETTPATTPTEVPTAATAIAAAKDAINNSTSASEEKAAANEALTKVDTSITSVQDAASKLTENLDGVSDADIDAYMAALKELNKNYEDANDKVSFFKRTDFNKQYVTAIAKANDFDVTLADGSKMSFSEFSTKMATKSPRIAEAMYNAKADRLEQEGHSVLAKMERNKAKMVGNWFGSKLTFADDLVRNQFNQMAETNMRATYAAYNNVLNDPNATPEAKTEARSSIAQANSLMRSSAALKASTGFWSGIGDGMGDGTYGTTDPAALNAYQKTLNTINNYTKVVLGLGVTPGANRAYQNMYYLAGDDVDKSALFNKDFNNDGFALCQEYGNNATAGMIAGAGELSTGVALMFNPSTMGMGANLIGDSVGTFLDGLYGVAGDVNKSEDYTRAVLGYFEEAKDIAEKSINVDAGNEEVVNKITSAISQIENFKLGSEEANSFDNWLEGSGTNTAENKKFNQALTYEEWLKLIEADPTMQEYAKKLIAGKRNAKENNADAGVNS